MKSDENQAEPSAANTSTPRLDQLREHVNKLKLLLDDAQPGLASWCMMYGEQMKAISDFWNDKPQVKKSPVDLRGTGRFA